MKLLAYYIAVLVALNILVAIFLVSLPKTTFFADMAKTALINLTNQEREGLGLAPLKENVELNEVAFQKAKDMLDNDYFAHSSPTGVSPWYWFRNVGYRYRAAGENLAVGFIDSEEVIDAWIDSPSHRANLFNPNFKEIGIAVLTGKLNGQETTLVVQSFGSPAETVGSVSSAIKTEELVVTTTEAKVEKADARVAAATQFIAVDSFSIIQKILFYSIILIVFTSVFYIFIKRR